MCVGMHAGLLTHMCAKMLLGFAMSGGCFKDQISFFFFFSCTWNISAYDLLSQFCVSVLVCVWLLAGLGRVKMF